MEHLKIGQATPKNWKLSEEQRLNFQALHILYYMVRKEVRFANFLTGRLKLVEKVIHFLEDKKLIEQTEVAANQKKIFGYKIGEPTPEWIYQPTLQAEKIVANYEQRLFEFFKLYDVFAHVDTETGNFAMEEINGIWLKKGDDAWQKYLNDERWLDLRIPVAVYKGIDPRELVFMSIVTRGELDLDPNDKEFRWAEKLFTDQLWDYMYSILDNAPRWEQFDFNGDAKAFMEDVIVIGADIVKEQNTILDKFIEKKNRTVQWAENQSGHAISDDEYSMQETRVDEYYRDPIYYHGPWGNPLSDPLFWMVVIF